MVFHRKFLKRLKGVHVAIWVSSNGKMGMKTVIVNYWYPCIWLIGEEGIRSFKKELRSFPAPIELLRWPFFKLPPLSLSPHAVLSSSLSQLLHIALLFCDCWISTQTIHNPNQCCRCFLRKNSTKSLSTS